MALAQIDACRRRSEIFGTAASLLGDPAWLILLEVYVAHLRGALISISSACIASGAPATTALRYVERLEEHGVITRRNDPFDRRRRYLELTPIGLSAIERSIDVMSLAT